MTFSEFWQAGGFGMYQVAIFGGIVLAAAGTFAWRPDARKVPFLRTMTVATLLAIAGALASNVGMVLYSVPQRFEQPRWVEVTYQGLFESLTPAILGFALLSVAWLVKAVGMRRLALALP